MIELAMTLAICGLVVGFVLQAQQAASPDKTCYPATKSQLLTIRTAVETFAHKNDRLPMPADITARVEDITYGREGTASTTTTVGTAPNTASWGAVPFQALGLSPTYAADCWGNKLVYVVTTALVTNDSNSGYLNNTIKGNITLKSSTANTINTTTAYAIISLGQDGLGAVKANASTNPNSPAPTYTWCANTGTLPNINCSAANMTVADAVFNDGKNAGANYYDDVIVAAGKPQILNKTNLYCWGQDNNTGVLATGVTNVYYQVPTQANSNIVFTSLPTKFTAGGNMCALTVDGTAYCWGTNDGGEVGDGTTTYRNVPTAVKTTLKFKRLFHIGPNLNCGIAISNGLSYCWGWSGYGGWRDSGNHPLPELLSNTPYVKLFGNWQRNIYGLAANGDVHVMGYTPCFLSTGGCMQMSPIQGSHKFADAEGGDTACGITSAADAGGAGKLYCWGYWGWLPFAPLNITHITKGKPTVVTYTSPDGIVLKQGDQVEIINAQGMTGINFNWFTLNSHTTSTTFELTWNSWDDPSQVDTSSMGDYTGNGIMIVSNLQTPTLAHGTGSLTFSSAGVNEDGILSVPYHDTSGGNAITTDGKLYGWGQDSYFRLAQGGAYVQNNTFPGTWSSVSNTNPAVVTANNHGFSNGDTVLVDYHALDGSNNNWVLVSAATTNTFVPLHMDTTPFNLSSSPPITTQGNVYKVPTDGTCFFENYGLAHCSWVPVAANQTYGGVAFTIKKYFNIGAINDAIGSNHNYVWGGWGWSPDPIGDGSWSNAATSPVPIAAPGDSVVSLSTHTGSNAIGLTSTGQALSWGANPWGSLGNGTWSESHSPGPVSGNHAFMSVVGLSPSYYQPSAYCALEKPPCAGAVVGGSCWYAGAIADSCATTCTAHGGYSIGTSTYAGDAGSDYNCATVATGLGISYSAGPTDVSTTLGCYYSGSTLYRGTAATTSADSAAGNARLCACTQ